MMTPVLRKILVVLSVAFAVSSPGVRAWLGWGLDQPQFADQGDGTLRATGWAFSIWGLIYAGLVIHAATQAFDHGELEPLFAPLAPSILAIVGCGVWIWASAADARWASVAIILASAVSAWIGLARVKREPRPLRVNLLAVWPIALLGGWLLPASALNILTVLTAEGLIAEGQRAAFGIAGISAVAVLAVASLMRGVSLAYAIPVVWGLTAVFFAEHAEKPLVAFWSLAGAGLVAVSAVALELRRRARA